MAVLLAAPVAAAQVPDRPGTLIVTNKAPSTATFIDVASGRTLATVPTGNGPHEIVLSKDGRTAVISDYGTGPQPGRTLTVLDVPNRQIARTIDLGEYRRPHGLAWLPGDSLVAVTVEASRAVLLVHVARQNGSHMVAVTADGQTAWTGDIGSNTVTELDLLTGQSVRHVEVPVQPEAINVAPDGSEVWVGSNGTGRVSVLDTYTGAVATAAEGFRWPYRIWFTPDAETVLLPDYTGDAVRFVARRSRRELGRLTFPQEGPQGIVVSPDGRTAFVSLSREARVVVIDVPSRTVLGHVAAGQTPDGVVFVPAAGR
ncbi:MAG: hypothetical protein MUD17_11595 [Gemmatimonadaceae bacterium]|nr:hypothetical protein [Gemmatimonadaceae bacterium]